MQVLAMHAPEAIRQDFQSLKGCEQMPTECAVVAGGFQSFSGELATPGLAQHSEPASQIEIR